jgi:hypothetical protein
LFRNIFATFAGHWTGGFGTGFCRLNASKKSIFCHQWSNFWVKNHIYWL